MTTLLLARPHYVDFEVLEQSIAGTFARLSQAVRLLSA
jgi:hypothetical protein